MTGRVFKRKGQTTWSFMVDLPRHPETGKRRQKLQGGFRTKKDAEQALAQLNVDVAHGLPGATSKAKVADFLADWHASTTPSLHANTAALNELAIRKWIGPHIGGMKIADVTPATLQGLYNRLGADGYSERTIRLAHTVMGQALGRALDWGLIGRNPATAKLKIPRREREETAVWTAEEARTFMATTAGDRLGPMWRLFLSTGLRRGEALGLKWSNVHLDRRVANVREARVSGPRGGAGEKSAPKTKASRRAVPLVDGALEALAMQRMRQDADKINAGTAWSDTGFVFTDPLGWPLRPDSVPRQLKSAAKRAGVSPITPKGLRHTFASVALEEGVHPKLVQTAMGHTQVTTTLGIYTHTNPALQRGAMETIGAALFKPIPSIAVTRVTEELTA